MNRLEEFVDIFNGVKPWAGFVPKGHLVDFLGTLTDARFQPLSVRDPSSLGGGQIETRLPVIGDGEAWFEAVNWIAAARAARERFVMITLGACFGAQAVGSYRAVQRLNPLPCLLVAVEPEPANFQWLHRHLRDNGIDPDAHWLVPLALSDGNDPVFFPVGSPGTGAQNCFSTNHADARRYYADQLIASRSPKEALRNLLIKNTTGLTKDLVPGANVMAEIKSLSAITLRDLLGPLPLVDYLESDIQQSEAIVFPPFIDLLKRKVRRIHIGTHGLDTHRMLHDLFAEHGWEIVFSFAPNAKHDSALGGFETNDGVLTVRNRDL
ncbi:MAG TPA: hypothetical protein VFC38_07160 [Stellaceae bacterium]|nr:hypothetical protein [Stellaceae bacterium]